MAIIDRGSNQQDDIYVVDPNNGRRTAVLVTVHADKAGDVEIHITSMGDGAPITVFVDTDVVAVRGVQL